MSVSVQRDAPVVSLIVSNVSRLNGSRCYRRHHKLCFLSEGGRHKSGNQQISAGVTSMTAPSMKKEKFQWGSNAQLLAAFGSCKGLALCQFIQVFIFHSEAQWSIFALKTVSVNRLIYSFLLKLMPCCISRVVRSSSEHLAASPRSCRHSERGESVPFVTSPSADQCYFCWRKFFVVVSYYLMKLRTKTRQWLNTNLFTRNKTMTRCIDIFVNE